MNGCWTTIPSSAATSLSSRSQRPAGSTSPNMPRNASDTTHSSARSTAGLERLIGCPSTPPAPPLFPAEHGPLLSRGRHLPRHPSPGRHEFSRQGVRSLPDLRSRGLGHFPLLRRRRVHAGRSHGQPLRLSADSFRHLPCLDHAQTRATTSPEGPLRGVRSHTARDWCYSFLDALGEA